MKHKLSTLALGFALCGVARADFNPIALTSGSYTKDMVVEKTAPATPSGAATTASMDAGTGNTGYSWYEQGYNSGAAGTGLPTAGSTFASAAFPTHEPRSAEVLLLIPIPSLGTLRAVHGKVAAEAVPLIESVTISMHVGSEVVPLPEGSEYLGFIFARGATPEAVEAALRESHRLLEFVIE